MSLWFNLNGILHDGVGIIRCDRCPCVESSSSGGSGSSSSSVFSGSSSSAGCAERCCLCDGPATAPGSITVVYLQNITLITETFTFEWTKVVEEECVCYYVADICVDVDAGNWEPVISVLKFSLRFDCGGMDCIDSSSNPFGLHFSGRGASCTNCVDPCNLWSIQTLIPLPGGASVASSALCPDTVDCTPCAIWEGNAFLDKFFGEDPVLKEIHKITIGEGCTGDSSSSSLVDSSVVDSSGPPPGGGGGGGGNGGGVE